MDDKPKRPENPIERLISGAREQREVLAGFFGWYLFNTAAFFIFRYDRSSYFSLAMLWPFVNIGVLLIFASVKDTRRVALGILIAVALNLFISLALGTFFNALCFFPFYVR